MNQHDIIHLTKLDDCNILLRIMLFHFAAEIVDIGMERNYGSSCCWQPDSGI